MRRFWTIVVAGTAVLLLAAGFTGPASAARVASAAKATPKISIKLTPHSSVEHDGVVDAAVRITGSNGVVNGEIDILGMDPGDCNAQDLTHGQGGCESDFFYYPVGRHKVSVDYYGSKRYRAATASVFIRVTRATTSVDLENSPDGPGRAGKPVTFTTEVDDQQGYILSGTVTFSVKGPQSGVIPGCTSVRARAAANNEATCRTTLPAGSYEVTARYSGSPNYKPSSASERYTIRPAAAPSITTTALPGGYVGSTYSTTLHVSGGTAPYTWKIVAGGLPDGLTLSKSGVISGTPTRSGKWSVTPQVTDSSNRTAATPLTLRITAPIDTDLAMSCPGATFDRTTTCTLSATNRTSGPAPTGSLQFENGRSFEGGCTLPATPAAGASSSSCTVANTWDGYGTYTADLTYFGDTAHAYSQGDASIPVAPQKGGVDTDASMSCPGAQPMTSVACTITIVNSPASATPAPTGTADFSYLNDEGESSGESCTLSAGTSTHSSRCTFSYGFDDVPSTVAINYHGDSAHHASLNAVTLGR